MIEFPATVVIYQLLARNAGAKGRSVYWGVLGIALWFGGEALGFLLVHPANGFFFRYMVALACALVCALAGFLVVRALPEASSASIASTAD